MSESTEEILQKTHDDYDPSDNTEISSSTVVFSEDTGEDEPTIEEIVMDIISYILDRVVAEVSEETEGRSPEERRGISEQREVKFAYFDEESKSVMDVFSCEGFKDLISCADDFVEDLIIEAQEEIGKCGMLSEDDDASDHLLTGRRRHLNKSAYYWPRRKDFQIDLGADMIDRYVQSIEFNEKWLYCIDYLGEYSDQCKDFYKYQMRVSDTRSTSQFTWSQDTVPFGQSHLIDCSKEQEIKGCLVPAIATGNDDWYKVRFSIPCQQYPVAQATASVYFTVESSRIKPPDCPVDVYYQVEGNRTQHIPWNTDFHEEWLFYVVDAKLKLFKTVTF